MAITKTFDRPLATTTAPEETEITAVVSESAGTFVVDLHFSNADITGDKALGRFTITPTESNGSIAFTVQYRTFDAPAYVSATDPLNTAATQTQTLGVTPRQSLDTLHTSAGDPRS
jgi:hypothetical protein